MAKQTKFNLRDPSTFTKKFGPFGYIDPPVFIVSMVLLLGFTIWGVVDNVGLMSAVSGILNVGIKSGGWLFKVTTFAIFVILVLLVFTKIGDIKLGKPEDKPEYGTFAWIAMLFGIGMGVGIVFWAVAEPLNFFYAGPAYNGEPGSIEAAEMALPLTFYHWTLAWVFFCFMGIALAYIAHRKGLPPLISTLLYPLLGDKIYGPIGKIIDILTVVGTFFGVCTTLGLGVMQLAAGVNISYGVPIDGKLITILLIVACAGYLASACLPISKGINFGSQVSLYACLIMMVYIFIAGPTQTIVNNYVSSMGDYVQNFLHFNLWMDPFGKTGFNEGWSVFYLAWDIAWGPCTALFLCNVSKGRTIREVVICAFIAPCILCTVFLCVFGTTAIELELAPATAGVIWSVVQTDAEAALYTLLNQFPGTVFIIPVVLFVIYTFFVVTIDASCIVMGSLVSGGVEEPAQPLKITFGLMNAVAAGVLIMSDGLNALKTFNTATAIPFLFVYILMIISFFKMLKEDKAVLMVTLEREEKRKAEIRELQESLDEEAKS